MKCSWASETESGADVYVALDETNVVHVEIKEYVASRDEAGNLVRSESSTGYLFSRDHATEIALGLVHVLTYRDKEEDDVA